MTKISKGQALEDIHSLMDGTEWDSDTLAKIAQVLLDAGYTIRDYDEEGVRHDRIV